MFRLLLAVIATISMFVEVASFTVDLTKFTSGTDGVRVVGPNVGFDVAQIGDHNGDGFADFVISAEQGYGYDASTIVIVMGRNTSFTEIDVRMAISGTELRVMKGSWFASSVGSAGDINGDGLDDVIVGALRDAPTDLAWVIFGARGPFVDLLLDRSWTVASTVGFTITSVANNDGSGTGVGLMSLARNGRGLGDVNGDGIDDFAVSAIGAGIAVTFQLKGISYRVPVGMVWVVFGKTDALFANIDLAHFDSNGVTFTGASQNQKLGYSVMPAGDFNNDGIADFVMSAPGYSYQSNTYEWHYTGAVYLIYGSKDLVSMNMSAFTTGSKGIRFVDNNITMSLMQCSGVGDINGDGFDDITIGVQDNYSPFASRIYVIFGNNVIYTADVEMLSLISAHGFVVYGAPSTQLQIAAPAGDVNGDGVADFLVGGVASYSKVHIIYGQRAARTVSVQADTDEEVMTFVANEAGFLGAAMDGGKDINGDGIPDILIGGYQQFARPVNGGPDVAGSAWMLPGPFVVPVPPTTTPSAAPTRSPTNAPSVTPTSAAPSVQPSVKPTAEPSVQPSVAPTVLPTETPTVTPTNAAPPILSTAEPSVQPSSAPSVLPSVMPSSTPSVLSTVPLGFQPTTAPSFMPTVRPTLPAARDFELVVRVLQGVSFMSKESYFAQQAAFNHTIQHTVAASLSGVTPERVTDIVVQEESTSRRRIGAYAATGALYMQYTVRVSDPLLSAQTLRAELTQAASEGKMDTYQRYYAEQFQVPLLANGTFAAPEVTDTSPSQSHSMSQLTDARIAGAVVGGVLCLALLMAIVFFALFRSSFS